MLLQLPWSNIKSSIHGHKIWWGHAYDLIWPKNYQNWSWSWQIWLKIKQNYGISFMSLARSWQCWNKLVRSNLPKSLVCIYNNQVVAAGLGSMSQQLMDNLGGWRGWGSMYLGSTLIQWVKEVLCQNKCRNLFFFNWIHIESLNPKIKIWLSA